MTTIAERIGVTINLESECSEECAKIAEPLYLQLSTGAYSWPCSVMPIPDSIEQWAAEHRTARKRAERCELHDYRFAEIAREHYVDDLFEINTSTPERQGRPMSAGYRERPSISPIPPVTCKRHALYTYGVLDMRGHLRAYTWVYRAGALVMFSTILGHAEHLTRHVMYLLVRGVLEAQIEAGPGLAFYNRHDSGTEGLRFFKDRCGFLPSHITWERA